MNDIINFNLTQCFVLKKYYLVGSNNTQTRFRVLKIDRTEPRDLDIYDDKVEYSAEEIRDLVSMIESGNRKAGASGITRYISAFGIVGEIHLMHLKRNNYNYKTFKFVRFHPVFRRILHNFNHKTQKGSSNWSPYFV